MLKRTIKGLQKEDLPWYGLLFPLQSTSQETWFVREATKRTKKVTIITAPRGYRKSWTAQRVCLRGHFLRPWCKFLYIDAELFPHFEEEERSNFAKFRDHWLELLCSTIIAVGFVASYEIFVQGKSPTEMRDSAWNETPSRWTLAAAFVMAFVGLKMRVRVLIFDDVTRMHAGKHAKVPVDVDSIRNRLNFISGLQRRQRVVIVSSNEALHECYSDINPTVRITKNMPPATPEELLNALNDSGCPMTLEQLQVCQSKVLEHHAHSIRFFNGLKVFSRSLEGLKAGEDITAPHHRAALWVIVDTLDLQCEPTLAAATLCMCPVVSLQECAKKMGFNVDPLTTDRVVPRRLALAYLMTMSAPDDVLVEQEALNRTMEWLESVDPKNLHPGVRGAFFKHLVPLLYMMERKLACITRVTLPGDKVIMTDVALTLRKEKLPRTVDGLKKAVLKEFDLFHKVERVDDVKVYPPGKERGAVAYDDMLTPLKGARREAPYHVEVV